MAIEYKITLHARTVSGYETIAEFFVGSDRQAANKLFESLQGSPDNLEQGVLLMELHEIEHSLLFDVQLIQCTLDEVAVNCRLITKSRFKAFNLNNP